MNLGILIWPVPEVNGPEAIITANNSEHLIVPPLHTKRWILKENFLQSSCVSHPTKVNSCQVVITCINHMTNTCLANIHHIYLQAGTPAHQCSSHRGSAQTCPGLSPEPAHCTPGPHSCSVSSTWLVLSLLADQLHACKYLVNMSKIIERHPPYICDCQEQRSGSLSVENLDARQQSG